MNEELIQNIHENYIQYCKKNLKNKSLVTCHTDFFKVIDEEFIRYCGYWYLRCNFQIYTYYQNYDIPHLWIKEFNTSIQNSLQTSSESNREAKSIISVLNSHHDFFQKIYDDHVEEQRKWNLKYNSEKSKYDSKDKKFSNYFPEIGIVIFIILFIYVCQYFK